MSILYPLPNLFLSSGTLPIHTNYPLTNIPILLHSDSASDIEWVVNITVACFYLILVIMVSHKLLRAYGSKPVDGSSKYYILGAAINAIATLSLRLFPPDNSLAALFL